MIRSIIATDVAARGLDITDVDLIVHFSLPDNSDDFIHRTGRTGRAKQRGKSISIVTPSEKRTLDGYIRQTKIQIKEHVIDAEIVNKQREKRISYNLRNIESEKKIMVEDIKTDLLKKYTKDDLINRLLLEMTDYKNIDIKDYNKVLDENDESFYQLKVKD